MTGLEKETLGVYMYLIHIGLGTGSFCTYFCGRQHPKIIGLQVKSKVYKEELICIMQS